MGKRRAKPPDAVFQGYFIVEIKTDMVFGCSQNQIADTRVEGHMHQPPWGNGIVGK